MYPIKTLTLATSNPGKIAELKIMLSPIECISQAHFNIPDADETGLSFIENAIIKARHASRLSLKPALADDSGLVVDVLDGQPGIYSARFASPHASDEDNIQCLLNTLRDIPDSKRQAYFYCAIALIKHADDPTPLLATGMLHGMIAHKPQGDKGFGYDSVFFLPDLQLTLAELSSTEKNKISHRSQALKQLQQQYNNTSASFLL